MVRTNETDAIYFPQNGDYNFLFYSAQRGHKFIPGFRARGIKEVDQP